MEQAGVRSPLPRTARWRRHGTRGRRLGLAAAAAGRRGRQGAGRLAARLFARPGGDPPGGRAAHAAVQLFREGGCRGHCLFCGRLAPCFHRGAARNQRPQRRHNSQLCPALARMDAAMRILSDRNTYCAAVTRGPARLASGRAAADRAESGGSGATNPARLYPPMVGQSQVDTSLYGDTGDFSIGRASPDKVGTLKTSGQQFEAVVDLLVHYDWYLRRRGATGQTIRPGRIELQKGTGTFFSPTNLRSVPGPKNRASPRPAEK